MIEREIIYRIAVRTLLDVRTIERVIRGEHVRPSTRTAVLAAARALRIKLPSSPAGRASREAA